ncbi:MAG: NUDIX hydrolase [Candidatus Woesearchaeota archaeon]
METATKPERPVIGTVCSALIENQRGEVLVKETSEGISLLGGSAKWSRRFPECLESMVEEEHNVRIKPRRIQGVFQNQTRKGSWITNISVTASCDSHRNKKDCFWVNKHTILEGADYGTRSPDLHEAVCISFQNTQGAGFDFVTVTDKAYQISEVKSVGMPVTGMVIINPYTEKFLLMQCGKEERSDYKKWSLLGGTVNFGEGRVTTVTREVQEEGGIVPIGVGLVGIYVNHVQGVGHITNIASIGYQFREQAQPSQEFEGEVKQFSWLSLDEIHSMDADSFRTRDTPLAIKHAEWLSQHGGFFDKNLVRHLQYTLPDTE